MRVFDPLTAPLSGRHLIEASAGTGKTFTIATLYLRVLAELGLRAGNVLVVTYTRAATAELRGRLRTRAREALAALDGAPADPELARLVAHWHAHGSVARARTALEDALRSFDEAAIHTIHAFCQRVLAELAFECGVAFDAALAGDEVALRDEIVRDFWIRETHDAPDLALHHLHASGTTLPRLLLLARRVAGDSELPILPRETGPAPECLDDALRAYRPTFAAARAAWQRERPTILSTLSADPGLNRNRYRPDTVRERWAPDLDRAFVREPEAAFRCPWIDRLTNAHVRACTKRGHAPPHHPFFDACDALHAAQERVAAVLEHRVLRLTLDLVAYVRTEHRRRRDARRTRDFDDLVQLLATALRGPSGADLAASIRARFPFALIDEGQDTDPQSHTIFRAVYESAGALYQIGDPKQAIFAFRGADVFAYLAAKRAAGSDARTLVVNWRSDPGLVRAVHAVFAARQPFVLDDIGLHPVHPQPNATDALRDAQGTAPALQILQLPGARDLARKDALEAVTGATARDVAAALHAGLTIDSRPVGASDFAVLCRTNKQAIAVQDALRDLRVPSVLHGDKSVFDTPEAEDVGLLVAALASPGDPAAIRAALATPLLGIDGGELHRLQEDETSWDRWVRRFEAWHQAWTSQRFMRAFRLVLDECAVQPRLLGLVDGERRLTNVLHLAELLHRAAHDERLGPLQSVRWLTLLRTDPMARADYAGEDEQIRLESDADAVTVVTVHKSKGLEYPIVYCPFFWTEGALHDDDRRFVRFHDPSDGRLTLDVGSADHAAHLALAEREALAESLRLAYVALTRARHRCVVVWGAFRDAERSSLAYLLHQPSTPPPGTDLATATATRFQGLDDDDVRRDLESLRQAAPRAIDVRLLDRGAAAAPPARPAEVAPRLAARHPTRDIPRTWRVASFTSLASTGAPAERRLEDGVDHDADDAGQPPQPLVGPVVPLHDFPAGAGVGQMLHGVLERLDFPDATAAVLEREIARGLDRHGLAPRWRGPLGHALDAALATPLGIDGATVALRDVARTQRLDEMEFTLPVAPDLTVERLADLLARHRAPIRLPAYAARLRTLSFEPLAGYLRGFIDLVFEHHGRWYVVDYKSNLLGATPADYAAERLDAAMIEHHYVLQYLLYAVAVHRHLAARLHGYEYERHFGGVRYLFLRGMAPGHPPGCGIYADRPPAALVTDLAALFGGTES